MKRFIYTFSLLSSLALAMAQDAAEQKAAAVKTEEKIIIQASRTNSSTEELTYNVNIVSREDLDKYQARNLEDALRKEVGVTTNGSARSQAQKPIIRGLSGGRVLTVIDGVRQNFDSEYRGNQYLNFDFLKQVEVVRGPSSALWGSGALGGVLSFETVDPSDLLDEGKTWGIETNVGFDSVNDGLRYGTKLFGREGNFDYLLGFARQEGNDVTLGSGDRLAHSSQDNYSTLAKVIWHATDFDTLNFEYENYYADEKKPLREIATDRTILDQIANRNTARFEYEHDDVNDIFDFSFKTYYTKLDLNEEAVTGASWDYTRTSYETIGFDLRNQTVIEQGDNITHTLTYGTEYFYEKQQSQRDYSIYPTFRNADQDNLGIYFQDEIAIGDKLIVTPGVRYDAYWSNPESGESVDGNKINPKLGVLYSLTDDIDLTANYASGFRAPTLRERYIDGGFGSVFAPTFVSNPDLEEEESQNFDIGFRFDKEKILTDNDRLKVNYTFFYSEYENFIELETTPLAAVPIPFPPFSFTPSQQQYVNVDDATIFGHELEIEYQVNNTLLWFNYVYNDSQNDETGESLSSVPGQTFNYGIDYVFAKDFTIGYLGQFVQKQTDRSTDVEPSYNIHDAYVRWTPSNIDILNGFALTLGVENMFDEEYEYQNDFGIEAPGRNFKTTLSYTVQF